MVTYEKAFTEGGGGILTFSKVQIAFPERERECDNVML